MQAVLYLYRFGVDHVLSGFYGIKRNFLEKVVWAFWGAIIFVIMAEKLVDNSEQFHFSVFYAAIIFLALYMGLIYLYKRKHWNGDAILMMTLLLALWKRR